MGVGHISSLFQKQRGLLGTKAKDKNHADSLLHLVQNTAKEMLALAEQTGGQEDKACSSQNCQKTFENSHLLSLCYEVRTNSIIILTLKEADLQQTLLK